MLYFAGDFHLGVPDKSESDKREEKLIRWLEFAGKPGNEIFLMGDVFDFWFEYKTVVPKGFIGLLSTLKSLNRRGVPVTMFKGNHDMWMFGYLKDECGVNIVNDGLELVRNEKKFFLHHGDGLGPGDSMYKFIRSVFRSRWAQWMFARLHPNFGMSLGMYFSRKSRISQKDKHESYLGDDKEFLTQFCKETLKTTHYDFMVFGHRHLVLDIELEGGCRYINTGEWVHDSSYAVFDGESMSIGKWE